MSTLASVLQNQLPSVVAMAEDIGVSSLDQESNCVHTEILGGVMGDALRGTKAPMAIADGVYDDPSNENVSPVSSTLASWCAS